jgi:formate--tetrahydrofolate ligase
MNIAEYTVTEAGFGSDLGAEKFLNIVCDNGAINPNVVVLVASIRSLIMHGNKECGNSKALIEGIENLRQHIENIKAFNLPVIVAINHFATDTKEEMNILESFLQTNKIIYSFTKVFDKGSLGGIDLAKKVVEACAHKKSLKPVYSKNDKLDVKISKIVTRCYGATGVKYSSKAEAKLKAFQNSKA